MAAGDDGLTRKQASEQSGHTQRTIDRARALPPEDPRHLPSYRVPGDGVRINRHVFALWLSRINGGAGVLLLLFVAFIAGTLVACALGSGEACEILRFLGLPRVRNNL